MLDILLPFVILKHRYYTLGEIFANFKGFLNGFIYNTLLSKTTGSETWLPHLKWSMKLLLLLLKYHDIELYLHLLKHEIELETFAVPWILTHFYRGVNFRLVYQLTEIFLHERDELLVLYFFISLLQIHKTEVMKLNAFDKILKYFYGIKIETWDELWNLYFYGINIRTNTPKSFEILVNKLKANNNNPNRILALEEIDEIGNFEDYDTLPMYYEELLTIQNNLLRNSKELLLPQTDNNNKKYLIYEVDYPEAFFIGKVSSENELNPYIKIATYMRESAVAIGENITKTVVLDIRKTENKRRGVRHVFRPFDHNAPDPENARKESPENKLKRVIQFFKINRRSINGKHIVILQNDRPNASNAEPDDIQRYMIVMESIKQLSFWKVSVLQNTVSSNSFG